MRKKMARWFVPNLFFMICLALFACSKPADEPTPPAVLSATDVVPAPQPTATLPPSPIPPTATPLRPIIAQSNIWELKPLYTFSALGNSIRAVALDPSGEYLAGITGGSSNGLDHRVRLWSTGTGELIAQTEEFGVDTWDVAFSPRGDSLALGLKDGRMMLYSVPELAMNTTFSHSGQVNSLAFSPDGMYLAAGVAESEGGVNYLWNVDQGVLVRSNWAHPYSVPAIAFSPNGQYLASGAVDRSVKIWQVSNGQLIRTLNQAGQGTSIHFSAENEWLGSAMCAQSTTALKCNDGQIWLWKVGEWSLDKKLTGPVDWVESLSFSGDGSLVAGGGRDYAIYLWDRSSGSLLRSVIGHQGAVSALDISRDGHYLASGATDESVILWAITP